MVDFMMLPASVYPEVINGVEQPSWVINLCWFREALAARLGGLGVCHRGPIPGAAAEWQDQQQTVSTDAQVPWTPLVGQTSPLGCSQGVRLLVVMKDSSPSCWSAETPSWEGAQGQRNQRTWPYSCNRKRRTCYWPLNSARCFWNAMRSFGGS